jgi:hypothetical protein
MARSVHSDVHAAPEIKNDSANVERVLSTDEKAEHMNYDRIDGELAKYANAEAIEISPEENKRLKRMIDRRVLPIMVFTYFLQALDKGTMSFASIMGLRDDIPVLAKDNSKVCFCVTSGDCMRELTTSSLLGSLHVSTLLF